MHAHVEVVAPPTADSPASWVSVFFGDGERYLFGHVAEGTQRQAIQRNLRMGNMNNLFLTGPVDWQSIGGLLGFLITSADARKATQEAVEAVNAERRKRGLGDGKGGEMTPIRIVGGRNLVHALACARTFIFRKEVPLRLCEVKGDAEMGGRRGWGPDWEDEHVRVWHVPLKRGFSAVDGVVEEEGETKEPTDEERQEMVDDAARQKVVRHMFGHGAALVDAVAHRYLGQIPDPPRTEMLEEKEEKSGLSDLPPTTESDSSLCYIVKNHPRRGKFDPKAAMAFSLKPGRNYKLLADGQSVEAPNGVMVHPHMVLGPTIPAAGFAVIDLRSADLIEAFLNRPEWSSTELMEGLQAMYWTLSNETKDDVRISEFMKKYRDLKHTLIGQATTPNQLSFESASAQMIKMHQIDPDRFRLPVHSKEDPALPSHLEEIAMIGRPGAGMQISPKLQFPTDSIRPPMNVQEPADEVLNNPQLVEVITAARKKITDPAFVAKVGAAESGLPTDGVEVITLGTGSAMPSKYRNVSSNLVRVPGWGNYILDCGENTLGQLRRLYGFDGADRILEDMRVLYISHAHADHHLGTASVLARRHILYKADPEKVGPCAVFCGNTFDHWLKNYQMVQDMGYLDSVEVYTFWTGRHGAKLNPVKSARAGTVQLPKIEPVAVDHCQGATAVVITWPAGLRIAYSGDCRPSKEFAEAGRGAHLLIHECTFDSEMQGEAVAKKHSTMAEALEVGRLMQADKIMLTHFSQRYPKMPVVEETDQTVLFAFDLMTVKLREFKYAAEFLPAIRLLLNEAPEEDEGLGDAVGEEGKDGEGKGEQGKKDKGKGKERKDGKDGKGNGEGKKGNQGGKDGKRDAKNDAKQGANAPKEGNKASSPAKEKTSRMNDKKRQAHRPPKATAIPGPCAVDGERSPAHFSKRPRVK
ncbi:hypothetical protein OQA88_78 [Cercophora sp. LCS_1]